jgi:hypothetical protein
MPLLARIVDFFFREAFVSYVSLEQCAVWKEHAIILYSSLSDLLRLKFSVAEAVGLAGWTNI